MQHLHEPMPQIRSSSYGSSRPSTNSTYNSYHPSFDSFSPTTQLTSEPHLGSSQTTPRPLSTSTTIRGLPSSSPVAKDGTLTGEHYTILTNMILNERSARQNLEHLVATLQEQVRSLSESARYPISSSDHKLDLMDPNAEFSSFEQDDSSEDEGRYAQDEVFRTPVEEQERFGDEAIFGDVLRNSASDEVKRGGENRTLSLSQITLGKGVQHAVNF